MEIIMGIKRIAALTMALTVSVSAMFSEVYAEENTVLDDKVIEQIYDENNDNTKDIKDLAMAANLSLDLKDIDDISFLKYAVSCRYLHLSNSTLTDFSVIKEMKNLVYVSMNNISPANLSFLENTHIKRCSLGGADISDEEKLRYVHAEDYIIPEGQLSSIGMYPAGLFEGEIIIKDTDIIGFGEYGDSENSTGMEGIVSAKKQGETEYSLVVDGKNLKTGRIKVIPQEIQDFPLEENIIKTEEITNVYHNEEQYTAIKNSDDSLWLFDGSEYIKRAENVKKYESHYSSYGNPFYILFNDGRMTINDEPVFDDKTKVATMDSSYTGAYVTTENNELWYVEYIDGKMKKHLISEDCIMFNSRSKIFVSSDSNCYYINTKTSGGSVYSIKNIELGQYDVSKIIYATYRVSYILDKHGVLRKAEYSSSDVVNVTVFDKNVTDIGILSLNENEDEYISFSYCPAYYDKDGNMYKINNNKATLVEEPEKFCLKSEDETYGKSWYDYSRSINFIPFDSYSSIPERFKEIYIDSDYTHMFSRRSENKTEYISFCGYYGAITNSCFSYGSESDGDDYIVLVVRTDGSLWEYYVAQQKFVRKDFGMQTEFQTPEYTAADIVNLIKYMQGILEEIPENADVNEDGIFNILDIIQIKNYVLKS